MPLICAFPTKLRNLFPSYLQFRFHQIAPNLQKHSLFSWTIWHVGTVKRPLQIREKTAVKNDNLLLRGNQALIALLTAPAASRFSDVLAQICGDGKGEARDVARRRKAPENPL
jgi:hypothetical protein